MSISLIVAAIGAVLAAVASGVLLARCFRGVRADVAAWAVAALGLLVSLGAQCLGFASGFNAATFRAMELGAQVIAPLAVILALSEVAGKSLAARFCARVYIPALAIVAFVVLSLDQLSNVAFTKAWPNPAVHYQTPPNYVLMFAVGPATAIVALIAVGVVMARSGRPGWNAVFPAQFAGGAAAVGLAYPALEQLVSSRLRIHLPISHEFSLICAVAAGLIWFAGGRTGRLRLGMLHGDGSALGRAGEDSARRGGRPGGEPGRASDYGDDWDGYRPGGQDRVGGFDQAGDFDRTGDLDRTGDFDGGGDFGRRGDFRRPRDLDRAADYDHGSGPDMTGDMDRTGDIDRAMYRDDSDYGHGWGNERAGDYRDDWGSGGPDGARGGYDPAAVQTGEHDLGYGAGDWNSPPGGDDQPGGYDGADQRGYMDPQPDAYDDGGRRDAFDAGAGPADERSRASLFGQIAIYTLLEDGVGEFDQLTQRLVREVRSREPDTLVYIVHAVPSAPMQRILYEVYRDRDAYELHRQQPYVAQFEVDRRRYVLATNVIELGLQQAKVLPFPSVEELFGEPGYDTSGFERPDYLRDYGGPPATSGGPRGAW
jgi:quinol monooxygenase YgiN